MQVDLMGERWKLMKMSCKIKFFPFTYVGKFRQIDVNARSNGPFKILKLPLGYLNLTVLMSFIGMLGQRVSSGCLQRNQDLLYALRRMAHQGEETIENITDKNSASTFPMIQQELFCTFKNCHLFGQHTTLLFRIDEEQACFISMFTFKVAAIGPLPHIQWRNNLDTKSLGTVSQF